MAGPPTPRREMLVGLAGGGALAAGLAAAWALGAADRAGEWATAALALAVVVGFGVPVVSAVIGERRAVRRAATDVAAVRRDPARETWATEAATACLGSDARKLAALIEGRVQEWSAAATRRCHRWSQAGTTLAIAGLAGLPLAFVDLPLGLVLLLLPTGWFTARLAGRAAGEWGRVFAEWAKRVAAVERSERARTSTWLKTEPKPTVPPEPDRTPEPVPLPAETPAPEPEPAVQEAVELDAPAPEPVEASDAGGEVERPEEDEGPAPGASPPLPGWQVVEREEGD